MSKVRRFTDSERDKIRLMFSKGYIYKDIGIELNRATNSIGIEVKKLGLSRRTKNNATIYAKQLGKDHTFFHTMNPDKRKIISKLGKGNLAKGFIKFDDMFINMKNAVCDISYTYDGFYDFARELHDMGYYKTVVSAYNILNQNLFSQTDRIQLHTFRKYHDIYKKLKWRLEDD